MDNGHQQWAGGHRCGLANTHSCGNLVLLTADSLWPQDIELQARLDPGTLFLGSTLALFSLFSHSYDATEPHKQSFFVATV